MTQRDAVKMFVSSAPSNGWGDYWSMQLDWSAFVDGLCRDGEITQRQFDNWGNPCSPETFGRWQRRMFGAARF